MLIQFRYYEPSTGLGGSKPKSSKNPPVNLTVKPNLPLSSIIETESIRQQFTPEADNHKRGKETPTHEANTGHSESNAGRFTMAGKSEHSGGDSGHKYNDIAAVPASARDSSSPRPSNSATPPPTEAASDATLTRLQRGAPGLEFAGSDGNMPAASSVEQEAAVSDQDDDIPSDEWEGEIIGEEGGKYIVAWKPTLIPPENASEAMIEAWEAKKARIMVGGGKTKSGSASRRRRVKNSKVVKPGSTGAKRGPGRPRKVPVSVEHLV